ADRGQDGGVADGAGADVVQESVVGLGDKRVGGAHVGVARKVKQVGEHGVGGARDAQRAGEDDRRFQLAELVDLGGASELAERVAYDHRGGDLVTEHVPAGREDRGDAGIDRVAAGDGRVADADPGHVGDRVKGARRQYAHDDADVARAGALGGQRGGGKTE